MSAPMRQFADVDKAVFKDGFGYGTGAVSDAHQHHKLGLHIRRKSRIGLVLTSTLAIVLPALYLDASSDNVDVSTGLPSL